MCACFLLIFFHWTEVDRFELVQFVSVGGDVHERATRCGRPAGLRAFLVPGRLWRLSGRTIGPFCYFF